MEKVTPSSDHYHNSHTTSSPSPLMAMSQMRSSAAGNESSDSGAAMRTAETLMRLIPIAPCIAALLVMLHNSQSNDMGSISYSHLGAFKYLVHVNGICAGYSFLSAAIAAIPRPFRMSQAWTLFILDQVMTYLVLAAAAVSTEVLYLAFKGDVAITWSSACSSFTAFCHKATASVAVTFVVVACYVVLSLMSSYKLFTNYDAPSSSPAKPAIQVTSFHA